MNISQDVFFHPSSPPTSAPSINGGLIPIQDNFPIPNPNPNPNYPNINPPSNNKRRRNLPGHPDPESEVVAMSPKSLMATNRFICEICNKGFQRDQNLQLHRRGHNLPWKLKQKANKDQVKKKVYVCPEKSCVHHDPSRALGDLTGIKKHFSRKHGEKKWKCDKCSKKYAVMSDWKAHTKICGTREYKCDCGTVFSRKDSFITHRAFCDALTEEKIRVATDLSAINYRFRGGANPMGGGLVVMPNHHHHQYSTCSSSSTIPPFLAGFDQQLPNSSNSNNSTSCVAGDNQLLDVNKSRLPIWLDHHHHHHHHHHQVVMNNQLSLAGSSLGACGPGHGLLQFSPSPNLNNLFASSSCPSSSMQQQQQRGGRGATLPKEEDEEENMESRGGRGLISLYSSSIGNMSATALLQKAAQIGSALTDNTSSVFATALLAGMMRPPSSNSSSTLNNFDFLQQKQLFRQQQQQQQLSGLQAYPTRNEQLSTMPGSSFHNYNFEGSIPQDGSHNNTSTRVGMRDFLGTLGGAQANNNLKYTIGRGLQQDRGLFLEEDDIPNYKLATMAASQDDHQQEPYMDMMR